MSCAKPSIEQLSCPSRLRGRRACASTGLARTTFDGAVDSLWPILMRDEGDAGAALLVVFETVSEPGGVRLLLRSLRYAVWNQVIRAQEGTVHWDDRLNDPSIAEASILRAIALYEPLGRAWERVNGLQAGGPPRAVG